MVFVNTPKQEQALRLIATNTTTGLKGGSRSGKTLINLKTIIIRALKYPGTKHLITMFRFADVKRAIWYDSMPKIDQIMDLKGAFRPNKSDWFYEGPRGSQVWVGGLDDKERADKILGQEYATLHFPEASRLPFDSYETARTRGNPPKGVPLRVLIDYNPPGMGHWLYKMFEEHKLPKGEPLPRDDFASLLMNPADNPNLSPEYIKKNLMTMSAMKRKRFLLGQYGVEEGALWQRKWIHYKKVPIEKLQRVVVGVDPTGSTRGDAVGIVIAGRDDKDYYILGDYTLNGTPKEWGDEVVRGYENFTADCIAAEKNFGGDMVESTITDMGRRNVNVKLVQASRGKIVRAEPISAMYERGQVYHTQEFVELEDELCTYTGELGEASPNRLDALTWALTELSEGALSLADVL